MTARLVELDVAKGMAIFLVVVGHIVARADVPGAYWYTELRNLIYAFHMPLFMVLSGMALGLSWKPRANWGAVASLVQTRLKQLLLPYVVMGVVIVVGKLVASRYTSIDNPPDSLVQGVTAVLLYPMRSPAGFLWYIHVLAFYFLVLPWLMQRWARLAPLVLLVLGMAAQLTEWPQFFNIAAMAEYLPFFSAGILMGQHWRRLVAALTHPWLAPAWLALFIAPLAYYEYVANVPKWVSGACSVPFFFSAAHFAPALVQRFFAHLGQRTLSIYLFNTMFIGLSKAALLPFIPFEGQDFIVYFLVLGLAGLFWPMLARALIVRLRPSWSAYL